MPTFRYMKKRGIDAGPTYFIIQAKPITGRKYVYLNDGRVTVEKEWQPTPAPFLLQACVKNDTMLKVITLTIYFYTQHVCLASHLSSDTLCKNRLVMCFNFIMF